MNWTTYGVAALLVLTVGRRLWVRRGVVNVSVHEVRGRLQARDTMTLVDVREPHEFKAGHISGAINIPLGQLARDAERLSKVAEVLVVCQTGNRSITAFHKLKALGFADVKNVEGGMVRWAWETAQSN